MRKMEYNLVIDSDYYSILNCIEKKRTSRFAVIDPKFLSPGIRLSAVGECDLEAIMSFFKPSEGGDLGEFGDFECAWQRCFRGEKTNWKINEVAVDSDSIVVHFSNEILWQEAFHHNRNVYPECWVLAATDEIDIPFELKIEVELPNGDVSTTLLKAGKNSHPIITELGSNYQRIIRLAGLTEDEDGNYAHIIEYTW